jgi:hypothetical protein
MRYDKSALMESKADCSHIALYHMLKRYLIFLNVVYSVIKFRKAQPSFIVLIIQRC